MTRFLLLALAFPVVLAGQERSFVWNDRYVLGIEQRLSAGLTFADVDSDGDVDALVANGRHWPQPNEVFLNNGAGRFTVSYELGPQSATTYAVPAGDLDGDGDPDVVVANDLAENWVYLNVGIIRSVLKIVLLHNGLREAGKKGPTGPERTRLADAKSDRPLSFEMEQSISPSLRRRHLVGVFP